MMNKQVYFNDCSGPLVAVDALGRRLPTADETGGRRKGRYVGMFYFLWCGEHSGDRRPLDVTKLLASDPKAGYSPASEVWGAHSNMHHWGEPLFGYYYSRDEWVMRKHIEMLTRADIDFLVFDTTNAVTYAPNARLMLRLLSEYRAAGWDTPRVVFYTNTRSGYTAQLIYEDIYARGYMKDSWFLFDGKPLIIAQEEECSPEVRDFFTIKMSQWPNEATKLGGWPWMDFERPQRVFQNLKGEDEIINVSVAQHPQIMFGDSAMYGEEGNRGRSFHDGSNDPSEGAWRHGYNFAEQWERAIEADPPFIFVTGWNEWIMGRWEGTPDRPIRFVDCANLEYSRDIEPMKGGYFDNYYLQLISYVRKYKGTAAAVRQSEHVTASIEDSFDRFAKSQVIYRDFPCGAFRRDCPGYSTAYKDDSGRNEIVECRAVHDEETMYFYARTAAPIERYDYHSTWMTLYLNVALRNGEYQGVKQRWSGYNYIANTYQFTDYTTSLSKCAQEAPVQEADTFRIFSQVRYKWEGSELMLEIPKHLVGLDPASRFRIEFKWADSRTEITRMEDFYQKGDAAPIGRLNYLFEN